MGWIGSGVDEHVGVEGVGISRLMKGFYQAVSELVNWRLINLFEQLLFERLEGLINTLTLADE